MSSFIIPQHNKEVIVSREVIEIRQTIKSCPQIKLIIQYITNKIN